MKTRNNLFKQAVLLVTDKNSSIIEQQYKSLKGALEGYADVYIMFHQKDTPVPKLFEDSNHYVFTNSVLTELGFLSIEDSLVPGSNHFPLFKFYRENTGYDYYWVIEDDVRFNGNWRLFFNSFESVQSDFITSIIRHWKDDPSWYWWITLMHPTKSISLEKRIASFNPLYRISNNALHFINRLLLDGWKGHHEVLLPTLLKLGGYSIEDFGGDGEFVLPGNINKFYISSKFNIKEATMRFAPAFEETGDLPAKLYHPVKDFYLDADYMAKASGRRNIWLQFIDKISRPVIQNLAEDKLKETMPIILSKWIDNTHGRTKVTYLEAFARTISGLAPWLNSNTISDDEIILRDQYRTWSLQAIGNAVNPDAKDYLLWEGGQPLVDASYFALALIRCPWLWENLDAKVQGNVIKALLLTRSTIPCYMNWILFSGMIEAFFCKYGYDYDPVRIEYCIREFANHWYKGDDMFSDGMEFHLDYYNSYVIHPYLANILNAVKDRTNAYNWFAPKLDKITKRYADIQERMINTDGSFPVTGRSAVYRGGAFHHLADMALRKQLPASLKPAQVREALSAVINKTLEHPKTFTQDGWLNIGLYGHQPDFYITTGSLYICTNIFLPLGLSDSDEFWTAPSEPWTSCRIWNGHDIMADHALDL